MKELLISFYCPSTSKSYDFWVTKTMIVEELIKQICDSVCKHEKKEDLFPNQESLILYSFLSGSSLPMRFSLEQAGIRSGDKLALV
jgi:hypothetical protein